MKNEKAPDKKTKVLIVHADDLGLTYSFNGGILRSHKEGILTSTCLLANGYALEDAKNRILPESPDLGRGVHICLNEGHTILDPEKIPSITNHEGKFRQTSIKGFLFLAMSRKSKKVFNDVEKEVRAQVEKIMSFTDVDHLNGHMHIHMIPWIFDLCVKICEEYKIPAMRIVYEPLALNSMLIKCPSPLNFIHYLNIKRWAKKHIKAMKNSKLIFNDIFYGLLHSGEMSEDITASHLSEKVADEKIVEILLHPGVNDPRDADYPHEFLENFCDPEKRLYELHALTSKKVKETIFNSGYTMSNYRELRLSKNEKTKTY